MRTLIAVPVYNEAPTVERVLAKIARVIEPYNAEILVIDDGSSDGTGDLVDGLRGELGLHVVRHGTNSGYGRSLRDAFGFGIDRGYDWLITIDCDEQHEPERIPAFIRLAEAGRHDLISGTRYNSEPPPHDPLAVPPPDRRAINKMITAELNHRLGLGLTDAFCGFKAHRVEALRDLEITEDGYAFPMQLWVQGAAAGWRVAELPVRLIYNDPNRTFGGGLDDATRRLAHYREVLHLELCRQSDRLPDEEASRDLVVDCSGVA